MIWDRSPYSEMITEVHMQVPTGTPNSLRFDPSMYFILYSCFFIQALKLICFLGFPAEVAHDGRTGVACFNKQSANEEHQPSGETDGSLWCCMCVAPP